MWIARLQGGECQQKLGEGWGCISAASMCKALGSILSTIKKKAHGKSNSFRESTEIPGEPILGTKKEGTA